MSKNPFKTHVDTTILNEDLEVKVQQWGKVKFKPNRQRLSKETYNSRKFDTTISESIATFNVIAKNARPESATPWKKFKEEILSKGLEHSTMRKNVQSQEDEQFSKQQERNHKKAIMLKKINEPTIWEDFQDNKNKDCQKKTKKHKLIKASKKTKEVKLKHNSSKNTVASEILQNFHSKTLTPKQNNHLRRLITKATINYKGTTLKQAVNNLKFNKKRK